MCHECAHDVVARQIHFKAQYPARLFKPEIEIVDPGKTERESE
jgi:hypothetical protein